MAQGVCPHLESDKKCKFTGVTQDGHQFQTYCLSQDGKWLQCANYNSHAKK